jgi:uncharacterized protein YukE
MSKIPRKRGLLQVMEGIEAQLSTLNSNADALVQLWKGATQTVVQAKSKEVKKVA